MNAEADVSLTQLGGDRGALAVLWARLSRIVLVSYGLIIFYGIDFTLFEIDILVDLRLISKEYADFSFWLIRSKPEVSYIVVRALTLTALAVFCLLTLNVYDIASHAAASLLGERELSSSTPATSFSCGVHILSIVTILLYNIIFFISSLICIVLGFILLIQDGYAFFIASYAILMYQIALLVCYIRGDEEIVVFLLGKQYLPDVNPSTLVPLQDSSSAF